MSVLLELLRCHSRVIPHIGARGIPGRSRRSGDLSTTHFRAIAEVSRIRCTGTTYGCSFVKPKIICTNSSSPPYAWFECALVCTSSTAAAGWSRCYGALGIPAASRTTIIMLDKYMNLTQTGTKKHFICFQKKSPVLNRWKSAEGIKIWAERTYVRWWPIPDRYEVPGTVHIIF